jgi:hypothetical protein
MRFRCALIDPDSSASECNDIAWIGRTAGACFTLVACPSGVMRAGHSGQSARIEPKATGKSSTA